MKHWHSIYPLDPLPEGEQCCSHCHLGLLEEVSYDHDLLASFEEASRKEMKPVANSKTAFALPRIEEWLQPLIDDEFSAPHRSGRRFKISPTWLLPEHLIWEICSIFVLREEEGWQNILTDARPS